MHGDVMLRICAFQMHSFRPDVSIEEASDVTGSVWTNSPCSILSYALCLASLGHLHSTTSGSGNDVVGLFKGKVFREMIRRLPAIDYMLADEIVPSILCLVQFELSRVSLEARTHLQALTTIRELERMKENYEFPIILEAFDAVHSMMLDRPTVTQFEAEIETEEEDAKILFQYLQQEQTELLEETRTRTATRSRTHKLLSSLEALMAEILNHRPLNAHQADRFFQDLEDFRTRFCTEAEQNVEEQYLARYCYHAFAITYNAVANKRPLRHPSNKRHTSGLYFALQANCAKSWKGVPRLELWILAVALSSSLDAGEKSLFQDRLCTAIYQLGVKGWPGVRKFLSSFLRVRNELRLLFKQATTQTRRRKRSDTAQHESVTTSSASLPTSSSLSPSTPVSTRLPASRRSNEPSNSNPPHPHFIPLHPKALTASTIENANIYPELGGRYPYSPPMPVENILCKGYAYLSQDSKFKSMIMRGDSGRISIIGTSSPESGWVALF